MPDALALWLASARAKVEAMDRYAPGFPSPLPWHVAGRRNIIWADDGDAIITYGGDEKAYFEKPVADLIILAINALPALLDVAEAAARVAELNDPANPVLAADVLPAWDALDAALARLAKGGE